MNPPFDLKGIPRAAGVFEIPWERVTLLFSDGYTTETNVNELKADGGIQEIQVALDEV